MKAALVGLGLSVYGLVVTGATLHLEQKAMPPVVESSYGQPVVLYKSERPKQKQVTSLSQYVGRHRFDAQERRDVAAAVADAGYVDYLATVEKELWK